MTLHGMHGKWLPLVGWVVAPNHFAWQVVPLVGTGRRRTALHPHIDDCRRGAPRSTGKLREVRLRFADDTRERRALGQPPKVRRSIRMVGAERMDEIGIVERRC